MMAPELVSAALQIPLRSFRSFCFKGLGDGIYDIEYRVVGIGDGVERWVATRGQTSFHDGRPVGFLGVALESRIQGQQRLVSSSSEASQIGHHAKVFCVKTATLVMGDYPDRADGFSIDIKGD